MQHLRIFISSVQKDLATERAALRDYRTNNPGNPICRRQHYRLTKKPRLVGENEMKLSRAL